MAKKTDDPLQERISEIKARLKDLEARRKTAEGPDALVMLDKEIREWESVLAALQAVKPPITPEDTSKDLTAPLSGYIEAHAAKVQRLREDIEERERTLRALEDEKAKAAAAADVPAILTADQSAEDVRAAIKYQREALEAAEASPIFPPGAVLEEWRKVCEDHRAEWETALKDLQTITEGYKAAAIRLRGVYDKLERARASFMRFDGATSYPAILCEGENPLELMAGVRIQDKDMRILPWIFRAGYLL